MITTIFFHDKFLLLHCYEMHTGRAWLFKILESSVCIIKLKILYAYADISIVLCSKIQNSSYITFQYQSSVAL